MALILLDYVFVLVLLFLVYSFWRRRNSDLPLPPGPRGLPVLGNALQIPQERPWLVYAEWAKQYGSLTHLTAFGTHLIIINDRKTAHDLLDRRNAIYNGRVHMTFAGEIVGWEKSVAMLQGPRHIQTRRMGQTLMSLASVQQQCGERMTAEAHRLLKNLLDKPQEWMDHYRSSAGAFIMLTTYGTEPGKEQDALIAEAKEVVERFSVAATPGNWIVDFIPILKYVPAWVPGFRFNATGKTWRSQLEHLVHSPFNKVKTLMEKHAAPPSLAANFLESNPAQNEELIRWLCGSLFAAGADTTVGALASFTLAMTKFPLAQRAAQAELDRVVGRDRLPVFADFEHMPYLHALVKEVLRWGIIVPMGFPHRLSSPEQDTYDGYRIPAGALLLPNAWAMSRDTGVYGADVEVFRPERYLEMKELQGMAYGMAYGSPVFGFGGRVCLGQHVAYATLLVQIASILAAFDISPPVGKDGKLAVPGEVGFSSGVVSHPEHFETVIRPRSAEAKELVQAANAFE
ncbi:cytochrome P450 [Dacryopinax primogenitus]|uniref:Cytochrome P450 n=1 Tax=Dacryopinax primogenitus (strain DJM 731) TaxID=1858805 RepID=M5FXB9_DACPD|nr:cytochrome P450 [Dacryopinax primogenitus]EJU01104.1 cytochrome P450 [Dacryopinax primogenitus]